MYNDHPISCAASQPHPLEEFVTRHFRTSILLVLIALVAFTGVASGCAPAAQAGTATPTKTPRVQAAQATVAPATAAPVQELPTLALTAVPTKAPTLAPVAPTEAVTPTADAASTNSASASGAEAGQASTDQAASDSGSETVALDPGVSFLTGLPADPAVLGSPAAGDQGGQRARGGAAVRLQQGRRRDRAPERAVHDAVHGHLPEPGLAPRRLDPERAHHRQGTAGHFRCDPRVLGQRRAGAPDDLQVGHRRPGAGAGAGVGRVSTAIRRSGCRSTSSPTPARCGRWPRRRASTRRPSRRLRGSSRSSAPAGGKAASRLAIPYPQLYKTLSVGWQL